ncbi:MAG: polysaccharide pyruvyl transferase family protein [Candidatus Nealsonbacteria bacterium]|nr:polysaccharide pyruvyl transferase family protein [Candidatus Nealsonbacteria bacterium]
MIVEVCRCSTRNKGAELMLAAIRQHFQQSNGCVQLAVERWFGSYEERVAYGLYHKLGETRIGRSALAVWLMPRSFRKAYGLVHEAEIDAVLDASGFAYGDQHGPGPCEKLAACAKRWKKQGKKVVLLPQALGPFTAAYVRTAFRRAYDCVDLVYARENVSYQHVKQLVGRDDRLRLAPDFTNLVEGHLPPDCECKPRQACIVPNSRMIEKTEAQESRRYVPFLAECISELGQKGIESYILIHDTASDEPLVEQLQAAVGRPLPVVREPDPARLKGILGSAYVVVGSRFHALVGALSQGVPSLSTSWSHKYEMLFDDYRCPEMVLPVTASREKIREAVAGVSDEPSRSAVLDRLRQASKDQKKATAGMWQEVDGVLGVG